MPNIREQRMDDNGIYIKFSNGREVSIAPSEILTRYALELGPVLQRKNNTIAWIKDTIVTKDKLGNLVQSLICSLIDPVTKLCSQQTLVDGDGMIDASLITVDFDETTGKPTSLEIDDS